jgi:hypothetical protein
VFTLMPRSADSEGMIEMGLVAGSLLAVSAAAWAWTTLSVEALLLAGLWLLAIGLGFGLPTGVLYHRALYRALAEAGSLPPRWWLNPIALHPQLPDEAVFRVLAWCRLGALGCGVAFLGCAVFGLGAVRAVLAS